MLVTLPFVLLLLDYWPLKRCSDFTLGNLRPLAVEKIPLFALTFASCVATALVPEKVSAIDKLPFMLRMENAVVSYVTYLWQMIHPSGLACVYPNPTNYLPFWRVAAALGLLLAISGAAFAFRKTRPYLLVGWLWYLGMMIPVVGIVQISYYSHADRYTYLPQIGVYLMLTWAVADLCLGWPKRRVMLGSCVMIILVALIFCTRLQASYWKDSESLWTHTLDCTSGNAIAHNNLGTALFQKGNADEASIHFRQALQINPESAEAYYNIGTILFQKRNIDEAIAYFQKALQINPDYADAQNNLGNAMLQKGSVDEATSHFQQALQINPDNAEAHYNLGIALLQKGSVDEAIAQYQQALQIRPNYAEAQVNLGNALLQKGGVDEAIAHYRQALQIKPDSLEVQNNLAWVLATTSKAALRNGSQAVELARQANQLAGGQDPVILHTLAAAYAEAGRFDDARQSAQKAMDLARAAGQTDLVQEINGQLKLYANGLPFHQEGK
jgi:tetratricopeptide (TPR) repeat protein